MWTAEVTIRSVRDGETATVTIIHEQKRGDAWIRAKAVDVASDTPEATRKIMLADNERLVIEGKSDTRVVFNKDQNAAVPVPTNPAAADDWAAEEEKQRQINIAREKAQREAREKGEAEAKAAEPKTNIGNPVPPTVPPKPGAPVVPPRPPQGMSATGQAPPAKPPVVPVQSLPTPQIRPTPSPSTPAPVVRPNNESPK